MDQFAAHEMHVFCRIADEGSFARAASALAMTPSAVSKLVSRLEARLGVRLITRTTRRLSLTGEGLAYLASARDIVAAIETAELELMSNAAEPSGLLRINTSTAFGRHILADLLPEFMARYRKITVDLGIADQQVDLLADKVDIAIRMGAPGDASLIARKIGETSRAICASPDYLERHGTPQSPADLANHNCMTVTGFPYLRRWPFATPEGINLLEVKGNFTSDSADILVDMMLKGFGIARLGRFSVSDLIAKGTLVEILKESHRIDTFPIHAVMPPGGNRSLKVRAFVDFLSGHPLLKERL